MYKLAVCVPTYNRARFLGPLLDGFLAQIDSEDVQIVVSDNASTDGTDELLSAYAAKYGNVKWVRSPQNLGPDRNYLRVVEAADAEYCWLFGSDDIPGTGAVRAVLEGLSRLAPDILLLDRLWCSYEMEPLRVDRLFEPAVEAIFDSGRPGGIEAFLGSARTICALFSYLSSIVVLKRCWDEAPPVEEFVGSAYAHSAKLLSLVSDGARLAYLPAPLVWCRGDNDHFLAGGVFNRCRIDFVGFRRLFDTYFRERSVKRLARRVMRREYVPLRLLLVVSAATSTECAELQSFLAEFEYPRSVRFLVRMASWTPVRVVLRFTTPLGRRLWWWRQRRAIRQRREPDLARA